MSGKTGGCALIVTDQFTCVSGSPATMLAPNGKE